MLSGNYDCFQYLKKKYPSWSEKCKKKCIKDRRKNRLKGVGFENWPSPWLKYFLCTIERPKTKLLFVYGGFNVSLHLANITHN